MIATLILTFVIFLEAVLCRFPTSSEYEIEVSIKNWLRHAPARIDPDEDEQQEVVNDEKWALVHRGDHGLASNRRQAVQQS